jgi:glycine/serine hydroxymethyltransferase
MTTVATFIDRVMTAGLEGPEALAKTTAQVRAEVKQLCGRFPMPH